MIPIKTAHEIELMRKACSIASNVMDQMCKAAAPGVNTYDLDQYGKKLMLDFGATSACYGYQIGQLSFPSYTCLSVNDEVVHGIGRLDRVLKSGDLLTVDVCVEYCGYIGDNARTVPVGDCSPDHQILLDVTQCALLAGIEAAVPGNRVGAISNAIESTIRPFRFGIVRDFVGHGVGRSMHEEPQIPNFGSRHRGQLLRPGMTLAIEPMVSLGSPKVTIAADGWTAKVVDGSFSAHFEHTVLVTSNFAEILTLPPDR